MKEINIKNSIINKARNRAAAQKDNKFTLASGGKLYGLIAEEIFLDIYGGKLDNTQNYDILSKIGKIDIKAKSCRSTPKLEYTASVADYQKNHKTDYYFFFRIKNDLTVAWILGGLTKEEFYKKSKFLAKGQKDGNFTCRADMNSVLISELKSMETLIDEVSK